MKAESAVFVLLDALGFRGVWTRGQPDEFADKWNGVVSHFMKASTKIAGKDSYAEALRRNTSAKGAPGPDVNVSAFSDTVALCVSGGDAPHMFAKAGMLVIGGFVNALNEGVFLRGAISFGHVYRHGETLVGPAVDDAAEWFDKSDWMGVSLTPTARFKLGALPGIHSENKALVTALKNIFYLDTKVPLSRRKLPPGVEPSQQTYALSWPWLFIDQDWEAGRQSLLEIFSSRSVDLASQTKYENTLAFYDKVSESKLVQAFMKEAKADIAHAKTGLKSQ